MAKKLVYLRVGEEPVRGPLDARAVIESVHTGVVAKDAHVSDTKDGTFIPVADLATQLSRARSRAIRSWLAIAVSVVVVGGAAAGGVRYYRGRPDKLCDATPRLLASLPSELAIDAYVTRGTPKLDEFAKRLETLLLQYEAAAPGKVKVRVIEANDEISQNAAKEAGLQQMNLAEGEENGDAVLVRKGYSGVVLRYRGAHDAIKYLPPSVSDGLEFWVTSKIRELHAREDHAGYRLAVAIGHGETSLRAANLVPRTAGSSPNVQAIIEQTFPFYAFVETDLTKAAPESNTAGLMIVQPSGDFSDAELSRIDEYVMQGHSLVIAASAVNVRTSDPTMTLTLAAHGLPKLLSSYGIHMHEDLVLDLHHSFAVRVASASGGMSTRQMSFMPLVYSGDSKPDASFLDKDAAIFFNMAALPFPFASSLTLELTKQPEATFHVLARSSTESALVTKGGALWPSAPSGEGPHAPAIVAASVEGVLTSGFGHGKSPKSARVLVLSSGAMFANPLANASNGPEESKDMMPSAPPTDEALSQLAMTYAQQDLTQVILAFKNSLDWMASDEDLARCAGQLLKKPDDDEPRKK